MMLVINPSVYICLRQVPEGLPLQRGENTYFPTFVKAYSPGGTTGGIKGDLVLSNPYQNGVNYVASMGRNTH